MSKFDRLRCLLGFHDDQRAKAGPGIELPSGRTIPWPGYAVECRRCHKRRRIV